LRNVGLHGNAANFVCHPLGHRGLHIRDHNGLCAFSREATAERPSDAVGAACDHHDFIG
jgi:hypothetical protein